MFQLFLDTMKKIANHCFFLLDAPKLSWDILIQNYKTYISVFVKKLVNDDKIADINIKALICIKMNMFNDAQRYTEESLKLNPRDVIALNNQGYILWRMHKYQEALDIFNNILAIDPQNPPALQNSIYLINKLALKNEDPNLTESLFDDNKINYHALRALIFEHSSIYHQIIKNFSFSKKSFPDDEMSDKYTKLFTDLLISIRHILIKYESYAESNNNNQEINPKKEYNTILEENNLRYTSSHIASPEPFDTFSPFSIDSNENWAKESCYDSNNET
ncbi:MAG: tetratricopeptide repeat protein [Rickettsiaceae bacterium]|nr:tetratricopeptide repeat protein [Rickettsiaceae bacterium]